MELMPNAREWGVLAQPASPENGIYTGNQKEMS